MSAMHFYVVFVMAAIGARFANGFSISIITVTPSIRTLGKFLAKNEALDILRGTEAVAESTTSMLGSITESSMKVVPTSNSPTLPAGCIISAENLAAIVSQTQSTTSSPSSVTIAPMAVVLRTDVKGVKTHIFFNVQETKLPAFSNAVKSKCTPAPPIIQKPPSGPTAKSKFSSGLSTGSQGTESQVRTGGNFLSQSDGPSVSTAFGTTSAQTSTNQGQVSTSSRTDTIATGSNAQATQTITLNAQGVGLGQGTAKSSVSSQVGSSDGSLPSTAASNAEFVVFGAPFKVNGLLSDTAQSSVLLPKVESPNNGNG